MKIKLSSAFSFVAFGAMLVFQSSAQAVTIYACANNSSGAIRITSATATCKPQETKISWDTPGPAGPAGAPGATGPAGTGLPACSAEGDVAVVQAGEWVCRSALPHYVDNGDGTVTDNQTGLMWEKKTSTGTGGVNDVNNHYTWSAASPFTEPTGTLYSDFLERLNDLKTHNDGISTPCFANHCDWRIPTIGELRSIISAPYPTCGTPPCIDPAFGPTQASDYWSSSSFASDPFYAWYVGFYDGGLSRASKSNALRARAVRGGR